MSASIPESMLLVSLAVPSNLLLDESRRVRDEQSHRGVAGVVRIKSTQQLEQLDVPGRRLPDDRGDAAPSDTVDQPPDRSV